MLMSMFCCFDLFFFFKQKTAYEMRISDWSSDVCSSDLEPRWECLRINMWCAAGSSGRNICLATRRSPSRRLPMAADFRSEEHTSELQSLMRISYAVFCLKKKNKQNLVLYISVQTQIDQYTL